MALRTLRYSVLLACLMSPAATFAWDAEAMFTAANRLGPRAVAGTGELQRLLVHALDLDDTARLAAVNSFFNRRIAFATDKDTWSQVDYWASPLELLGKGAGDCEDFAIAKYFSLHAAGIPGERLRLVYARIQLGMPAAGVQPHMVLAYYPFPSAEPWILDNLVDDIRPASRRPDLTSVFSFNGDGLWQGLVGPPLIDAIAGLSRWPKVSSKATVEGFRPDS